MKKSIIIILVLISLIMLFPMRWQFKDGGSVEYRALLYTVYDVHAIYDAGLDGTEMKYVEGFIIEIFGIQVYNSTNPYIESFSDQPNLE